MSAADMSHSSRTPSTDESADSLRKRVCKACDRCRLKKSKCDGASPCTRCKADNAICVFGERKKSHDKVYPKGYVEMLEQQQGQLVSGLQEMYRRLLAAQQWTGPVLSEEAGHPLTHDILAALDLLESKPDGSGEAEMFEEDCDKLQSRLFRAGAPGIRRKGSVSSDSDHSQRNSICTAQTTPDVSKAAVFKEPFTFSPSPSPLSQSPAPRQQRPTSIPIPPRQSPLHTSHPITHDPQFYQSEWTMSTNPEVIMRSKFAMQAPTMTSDRSLFANDIMNNDDAWMELNERYESPINGFTPYQAAQFVNPYATTTQQAYPDYSATSIDPMDLEFNRYIQVST